ncbi:MAG: septation protein SepH [Flaviflexus sp.]|nr:septation protein SepH [Flaviflexus sp.]
MLELQFLGIGPDGQTLTLNDNEGNRYSLPITPELRGALRKDRMEQHNPTEEPKPMGPKEIQALFRSGSTLEEVCDLTAMPASQLSPFAHPILAEREYMAAQARGYRIGHEVGAMTLEELVSSRLRSRDIAAEDISWDAVRHPGENWELIASYVAGGRDQRAVWSVDTETKSVRARNDEAKWLSETEIPVADAPWRPLAARTQEAPAPEPPAAAEEPQADGEQKALASMLDGLNARRGRTQPMPGRGTDDGEEYPPAAHPPASQPDEATDATVLSLPPRAKAAPSTGSAPAAPTSSSPASAAGTGDEPANTHSSATPESAATASPAPVDQSSPSSAEEDDGLFPVKREPKKRRSSRPAMPSWDEIVFGHPRND